MNLPAMDGNGLWVSANPLPEGPDKLHKNLWGFWNTKIWPGGEMEVFYNSGLLIL